MKAVLLSQNRITFRVKIIQNLIHSGCSTTVYGAPTLTILVCPLDQSIPLTDLSKLKDMKMHPLPFCFIPTSLTFPTINAIIIDDKFIITVQVTVSCRHSAKPEGFEQISTHLPAQFRNKH